MDLPPVGGTAPATPAQAAPQQMYQQQRPSLSYFILLSVLFYIMSNNSSTDNSSLFAQDGTYARMESALALREAKRHGLARWLGVANETDSQIRHNHSETALEVITVNGTILETDETKQKVEIVEPVEFVPNDFMNPKVLSTVQNLLDRNLQEKNRLYAQNLTGFTRGEWHAANWITGFDALNLTETYNTTELRMEYADEAEKPDEPENEAVGRIGEEQDLNSAAQEASERQKLFRRQDTQPNTGESTEIELPAAEPAVAPKWVNVTVTHNRTELRNEFDFARGGKITFNLREEQTSIPGRWRAGEHDSQLVTLNTEDDSPLVDWETRGPVTWLKGDVTLTSIDGIEEFSLDVESFHFLSEGVIYGFATPSFIRSHLFDAIGLPLIDSRGNASAIAAGFAGLNQVDQRIESDRRELEGLANQNPREDGGTAGPGCTFSLYAAMSPLPAEYTPASYSEYYASLFLPTGASIRAPPASKLSYVMYSDNCALVLEGEGEVLPSVRLWERATNYALLMALAQICLVLCLVRQMETSRTAGAAKVAYITIGLQVAMDAYFFIIHFTVGIVTHNRSSLVFLVAAFLALVSALVFGMQFASTIRQAQPISFSRPAAVPPVVPVPPTPQESAAQAAETRAHAAEDVAAEAETPLLPTAVPASTEIPALFQRPTPDSSDLALIGLGLTIAVFAGTVISIWGWLSLILILAYSFWVPQIILNLRRGTARQSLRREYILGTTAARLVLPFYFWAIPTNVLAMETSRWIYALVFYASLQAIVLLLQDSHLGARFFLSESAISYLELETVSTWNYHPALTADIETQATAEDCPICLSPIRVKPEGSKAEGENSAASRYDFMVPPCHHICHTECLKSWLAVKAVCPICRSPLPSL